MGRGASGVGGGSRGFSSGGGFRPSGGHHHTSVHVHSGGFWNGLMFGSLMSSRKSSSGEAIASNVKYKKTRNKPATFILGAIFLALCVVCIVCANIYTYKTTDATVVSYRAQEDYPFRYYATYTYTIKGQQYTTESQVWFEYDGQNPENIEAYKIGTTQRIKYKNTEPTIVYEIEGSDYIEGDFGVAGWVIGVILGVVAVMIFVFGVNKVEAIEQPATEATGAKLEDGQVRCKYCGGILGKDDDYCGSCGARKG